MISASLGNALQVGADWLAFAQADKLKHFAAYATLAVLWSFAFRQNALRPTGWLWLALFAMGAALEGLQWAFYPERFFEFADMLANGVGAAAGLLGFLYFARTLPPANPLTHGH